MREVITIPAAAGGPVQRRLGDGHDLTSPRFSQLLDLEAAFDGERSVRIGDSGRGVQAIQQSLYDLGFALPTEGADGHFGRETLAADPAFQRAHPPLVPTASSVATRWPHSTLGSVRRPCQPRPPGPRRGRFRASATPCARGVRTRRRPANADRPQVIRQHLVGRRAVDWHRLAPAPSREVATTGTEIGVLNSSCEEMAETLYHEVLHAEQPTHQTTTPAKESYAYRIGEEFSIAMGLGGRSGLRSTGAQGREFADPAKVDSFVAAGYPSVPNRRRWA